MSISSARTAGKSKGFGRQFVQTASERGDQVAATARNVASLADLIETYGDLVHPIELGVTDRTAVGAAIADVHKRFGRIDVVVNNAGYGFNGAVEETSQQQLRDQL
nr:SDR family NAD(P)-dependent oxidoreductase [Rhodococcus sp. 06-235-1A]